MVMHDGIEHAGYLSFLFMLTIFPFLVFFVAVVGFIGNESLGSFLVELIVNSHWAQFIDALKPRIVEITSNPPQSLLTIAIISAIWTASSIFEALRTILNRANRVSNTPAYILRRLVSIIEFIVMISVTICFLLILLILPYISDFIINLFGIPKSSMIAQIIDPKTGQAHFIIMLLFTFFIIAYIYHSLPNCKNKFIYAIPGTILTFIGWYGASIGFRYYLTHFPQVNLIYGSIAGIIIALLYFYICSIIFIVGAEFNYHMHNKKG
jgi:membrane protein